MASFSSGNDNFTASNSKQGSQSSLNIAQQAVIKEFEDKITDITNSLQNVTNDLNDFKKEVTADLETKQDSLIPGSHITVNEANIISSNQIDDTSVSRTETYSSDKIKSITDTIEDNVNTKANISYVNKTFEDIRELIDTKQAKLTAGNGITISDNTISTINYIDNNEPADNKSYSSLKTTQLVKDVYDKLYEYINSANYDSTIVRIDTDSTSFGSIVHAYSGITPGTYGTKDYADTTLLPCFTVNSEGHAVDVRLDEIYPPVTAGRTYDYWISNGSKRGNWQTPDNRPIDGSHNLITSGAVFKALFHTGVFSAGLNIDITDYVISCTAIDNENVSDTKTFSSSKIQNDMQQLDESITNIEALIPAQATVENILADRDFVNSSINSVTAFYITSDTEGSPFATKAALDNAAVYYYAGTARVPTANDYCVVLEDETHENKTVRYVYQSTEAGEGTWAFQYIVNDTSFTSDQLAAINSGITASKVNKYDAMSNVEHITSHHISAQHYLYRSIVLSVQDAADVEIEDGDGNCTLTIYNDNNFDNVLKSVYGDEITVLGAHEFVVLMYSSGWKVVARQNNDTEKKVFITEAADPVNLTEQDDTHYIVQITSVDNIPIDGVILAQLPATAKDGTIYTITNMSDRRLEAYTLVEPAHSPFSTRDDSIVIEQGCTMQFVYVARTPGWFATTEALLSYHAYEASHATTAGSADKATNDSNGNNIADTYATKTSLDNKADVANTNYKTTKTFYGNRNSQYVKIGSIPISSGSVSYAALSIDIFSASPLANFPVGSIILNMSSGSYATGFNINGYSSIPLNDLGSKNYPHIVVEKTSTDYILYVVSAYSYLAITVTESFSTRYTRGNFEEVSTLSGTVVYDSTVDNQIILVNGNAATASSTSYWELKDSNFEGNVNDLEIGRWYSVNTAKETVLNAPNKNGWASILTFAANNNPSYKQQLCMYTNGNNIYTRTCFNDSWSDWQRLAKTSDTVATAYSGMVHTCSTGRTTKEKTVSVPGFILTQGACIRVVFTNGNNMTFPELNVNGTGAKEIYCARGRLDTQVDNISDIQTRGGSGVNSWDKNTALELYYDGVHWQVIGDPVVKRFYQNQNNERRDVTITGIKLEGFLL